MAEYKNSTDIREVSAVVGYCREVVNKDKDEDGYHRERELREYRVKVTFEIDGETYPRPHRTAFRRSWTS